MRNGPSTRDSSSAGSPPPFGVAGIEDVVKRLADVVERPRVAVAGHRPLHQRVEPPDIVDAQDVIGVAVREEDRVDAADVVAQRLRAQVGPGVDEHLGAAGSPSAST